jgi:hypothetical protein
MVEEDGIEEEEDLDDNQIDISAAKSRIPIDHLHPHF